MMCDREDHQQALHCESRREIGAGHRKIIHVVCDEVEKEYGICQRISKMHKIINISKGTLR